MRCATMIVNDRSLVASFCLTYCIIVHGISHGRSQYKSNLCIIKIMPVSLFINVYLLNFKNYFVGFHVLWTWCWQASWWSFCDNDVMETAVTSSLLKYWLWLFKKTNIYVNNIWNTIFIMIGLNCYINQESKIHNCRMF